MLIKEITLVNSVFTITLNASLVSVRGLVIILAVWWGFFALKGYCGEGYFSIIAQINVIPEYLGDLESVWDLLLEIGC
jgi:hypothetical protein